jgi:hypothetical protein
MPSIRTHRISVLTVSICTIFFADRVRRCLKNSIGRRSIATHTALEYVTDAQSEVQRKSASRTNHRETVQNSSSGLKRQPANSSCMVSASDGRFSTAYADIFFHAQLRSPSNYTRGPTRMLSLSSRPHEMLLAYTSNGTDSVLLPT